MDLIKTLTAQYMKPELPAMRVGDTVRVTVRVTEGNRERTQAFEGTIIAKKHGVPGSLSFSYMKFAINSPCGIPVITTFCGP